MTQFDLMLGFGLNFLFLKLNNKLQVLQYHLLCLCHENLNMLCLNVDFCIMNVVKYENNTVIP